MRCRALAVFQMRRHLAETPRYQKAASAPANGGKVSFVEGFRRLIARRDLRVRLIGASLTWFMMDFAYYGNTVSSPLVLHALSPSANLITQTQIQLAVFAVAAVPGYFVAAMMMDWMGRKPIQVLGFAMMAMSFLAMALIPGIETLIYPFLVIYGLSYFFTEFGPNATTFVYPAELFPVEGRTTGHGIASAAGKLGGFVGVFTFPLLMAWHGLLSAELGAAIASLVGLGVTLTMLPETKGRSLEELSEAPDGLTSRA
ncbi:MAG: MFS transporter [Rhodospirillales bacterium]